MMLATRIRLLDRAKAEIRIGELAEVLVDCVAGGASVSFMEPFGMVDAIRYWRSVVDDVGQGRTALLAAWGEDGAVAGTVQLKLAMPANQPHRAEIEKLLVHRRARGGGVGMALLAAAEAQAVAHGRSLLTLDTMSGGAAEQLYERLGWNPVGRIPGYSMMPNGQQGDTTIFWKRVGSRA